MRAADRFAPALEQLRGEGLYRGRRSVEFRDAVRARVDGRELVCFCSNDYLGLARDPRISEALITAARRDGVGSGSSHLVSGHSHEHRGLEEELAQFLGRERVVLFSTGYMANLGVISALLGRSGAVVQDRLNHASLIDAGLLSGARLRRYAHGDANAAGRALALDPERTDRAVVTDGVFSMDGDLAPLRQLIGISTAHGAWLIVDDAHGIGVLGDHGRGTLEHLDIANVDVPVLIGTLGKAFGSFGAFVAGDASLCDWLVQKARTYIYTTAIPPALAAASRAALEIVQTEPERRAQVLRHVERFKTAARELGLHVLPSSTPIQPLIAGTAEAALNASAALEERGIWVGAIRPPTVPAGSSRLRITFSAAHSPEQVDRLCAALGELRQSALLPRNALHA